jgi:ribosomal protein S12 methylthiotransferase
VTPGGERPAQEARRRRSRGARFALVTLGCPKNEADSDRLAASLAAGGHEAVTPPRAELLIVNTCGFIDAAKEESIAALLDVIGLAAETGARVAAHGCLVQRYRDELAEALPEVDVFSGFDLEPLRAALDSLAAAREASPPGSERAGAVVSPARRVRPVHAYVKISDGCDHRCSFCAIPLIKGRYEAVAPDDILAAAGAALTRGARELVLVGQDTARWSYPDYGALPQLLADLRGLGPQWLRLLYLQPENVSESLLEALSGHAVPYVDIPFQHASGRVLGAMRRHGDAETYLGLLERVRDALPGVALRSTFLVGFPGESEVEFGELLDFVAAARPAVGGVFVFDPQEGTAAASMPGRVPGEVADERAARLQEVLDLCAARYWRAAVGTTVDVLVERGVRHAGREAVGRIATQAPDTDGVTYVRGVVCRRGQTVRARVDGVVGFDLTAQASDETG